MHADRRLALQLHPDKNQGESAEAAAERFKEVCCGLRLLHLNVCFRTSLLCVSGRAACKDWPDQCSACCQVATAYGILGDADKRRRYDVGGYASLEKVGEADLALGLHTAVQSWPLSPCKRQLQGKTT